MLQKLQFAPGFNKQVTPTGGEGQWVGGDYVRFRYFSTKRFFNVLQNYNAQSRCYKSNKNSRNIYWLESIINSTRNSLCF